MRKVFLLILSVMVCSLFSSSAVCAYAKDKQVTLIYTGETHAMLYPCSCPVEPDGGVARRATLVKQLRKQYPDSLLLDSGNFFSGGSLDQYSQGMQLDKARAIVNLKAMELMQYDALAISDDEFNFGKDFLDANMGGAKLNFACANLKTGKTSPYIIKEAAGFKFGIIGLLNPAVKSKSAGLNILETKVSLSASVKELQKKGVTLIVLLSNLGEDEDLKIIKEVPGISVVIDGHNRSGVEPFIRSGSTFILRTAKQARRLGKAVLNIKDGKINNASVEELRVSDKLADDPGILKVLPRCFADTDCKKEGLIGACQNAGEIGASCLFTEAAKVNLTVVTVKDCSTCKPEAVVSFLRKEFPGLEAAYIYYPDKKAAKFTEGLNAAASGLPVYFLGKEIEKEANFKNLKSSLIDRGDYYMLNPEASGVSFFLNRDKIKGKLDLFISLFGNESAGVLNVIREFNPAVHFLAIVNKEKIEALRGEAEAEEDLRAVCVQKHYPDSFWNYITCRAAKIESSWWEDCAAKMDINKIKSCAKSDEGRSLLKENSKLAGELKIMFGPAYLFDNQNIFATKGAPSKEELKKIIKR
jgi:hypothetical protein